MWLAHAACRRLARRAPPAVHAAGASTRPSAPDACAVTPWALAGLVPPAARRAATRRNGGIWRCCASRLNPATAGWCRCPLILGCLRRLVSRAIKQSEAGLSTLRCRACGSKGAVSRHARGCHAHCARAPEAREGAALPRHSAPPGSGPRSRRPARSLAPACRPWPHRHRLAVASRAVRAAGGAGDVGCGRASLSCYKGSVWGSRSRGRACSWTCTCCCSSCPPACTAASARPPPPPSSSSSTSSPGPPPSPPSRPRPNRPPHVPVLIAQLTSPPPSRPRPTRPPHAPGPPFSRPSPCVRPGDHVDSRRAGESACRRVGRAA